MLHNPLTESVVQRINDEILTFKDPNIQTISEDNISQDGIVNINRVINNDAYKLSNIFIDGKEYRVGPIPNPDNSGFILENGIETNCIENFTLKDILKDKNIQDTLLYKYLDRYIGILNPYRYNKEKEKLTLHELAQNVISFMCCNPYTRQKGQIINHTIFKDELYSKIGYTYLNLNNHTDIIDNTYYDSSSTQVFNKNLVGVIINNVAFYGNYRTTFTDPITNTNIVTYGTLKDNNYLTLETLCWLILNGVISNDIVNNDIIIKYGDNLKYMHSSYAYTKNGITQGGDLTINLYNKILHINLLYPVLPKLCDDNDNNISMFPFSRFLSGTVLEISTLPMEDIRPDIPLEDYYHNTGRALYYYSTFLNYKGKFGIASIRFKKLVDTDFYRLYVQNI